METLESYDYLLPEDRIARYPPPERDGGRLFVVGPPEQHLEILALPDLLMPGDLLVVNDTRVLPARVQAMRASGGAVEVVFLGPSVDSKAVVLCRPGRRLRVGEKLRVGTLGLVELVERLDRGRWKVLCDPPPLALMEAAGQVPLPPYLGREAEPADLVRYQTVYASRPGAVAAPTAGLHLSERLLAGLGRRGIDVAPITLHVGPGTFRNLVEEDLARGRLHPEAYEVGESTCEAVRRCRERGGRVVAVGTTVARALESATPEQGDGIPRPLEASTELFIRPGHSFRCLDALLTNFHLPRSSLLMLVSALVGREKLLQAYATAVDRGYRFYSYGDAMFVEVQR